MVYNALPNDTHQLLELAPNTNVSFEIFAVNDAGLASISISKKLAVAPHSKCGYIHMSHTANNYFLYQLTIFYNIFAVESLILRSVFVAEPQYGVTNITIVTQGKSCVTLTWHPPKYTNGNPISYEVSQHRLCQVINVNQAVLYKF